MEIADYPNYLVYEDGRIFSIKSRKMLKPTISHKGYHRVFLCNDGKKKGFRISRLVAIHYIPNPENKPEVDHIDRNKTNNHVSNLRWVTRSENQQNTGSQHNNKLGIKNICYHERDKAYQYRKEFRGQVHCKNFKTLEEALAYKQEYESTLI